MSHVWNLKWTQEVNLDKLTVNYRVYSMEKYVIAKNNILFRLL